MDYISIMIDAQLPLWLCAFWKEESLLASDVPQPEESWWNSSRKIGHRQPFLISLQPKWWTCYASWMFFVYHVGEVYQYDIGKCVCVFNSIFPFTLAVLKTSLKKYSISFSALVAVSACAAATFYTFATIDSLRSVANTLPSHVLSSFHRHCYVRSNFHKLEFLSFLGHQFIWNDLLQQAPNPVDGSIRDVASTVPKYRVCFHSVGKFITLFAHRKLWIICKEFGDESDPLDPF